MGVQFSLDGVILKKKKHHLDLCLIVFSDSILVQKFLVKYAQKYSQRDCLSKEIINLPQRG